MTAGGRIPFAAIWSVLLLAGNGWAWSAGEAPPEGGLTGTFTFKNWHTEHGLPQMTPRAITQTHDGYLWVGTYNGLARFDGLRFTTFTVGNTPELVSDSVTALLEDRAGSLWIGTGGGGLVRYHDGRFTVMADATGFTEHSVTALCEDESGRLWVGTATGLFHLETNRLMKPTAISELSGQYIHSLRSGRPGEIWIAIEKAVGRLVNGQLASPLISTPKPVHTIIVDHAGVAWIGFAPGGLAKVHPAAASLEVIPPTWKATTSHRGHDGGLWIGRHPDQLVRSRGDDLDAHEVQAEFNGRAVQCIYEDRQGNLWVGVESSGLWQLQPAQLRMLTNEHGLGISAITSLGEDHDGRIWVGTFGKGLHVWEGGAFRQVPIVHGAVNVTAVLVSRANRLWAGTYGGNIFYSQDGAEFSASSDFGMRTRTLHEDLAGGLWIGTLREGVEHWHDGRLTRHTVSEGLSSDHVQAIIQDAEADIWIGTLHGLNRIRDGVIENFHRADGLAGNNIRSLFVDRQGTLWIGATSGGLTRYRAGRFQTISMREGLINDWIEQIIVDDDGHLWLGSNAGIMRVSLRELHDCLDGRSTYVHGVAFRREDGLLLPNTGTGFQPSALKTRSGQLWFGTGAGLVVIDPKAITADPLPPSVFVEEVQVDEDTLRLEPRPSPPLVVGPGRQRLAFRYTALDLSAPAAVRFRYKLAGYDADWINAGTRREAAYTGLPPGRYRFQVLAANHDGVWNETGASLALVITPAWWQTGWFRAAVVLGLCGIAFAAYEYRAGRHRQARAAREAFSRRLIESQEQERERLAGELHDSLGQSLQIIKGRAQLGLADPDQAANRTRQLEEIAQTAARAIDEVRTISHALRPTHLDQLGLTRTLEWLVESASESSGIRFAHELDELGDLIPPEMAIHLFRIAQEGIHNVLKHSGASEVIIELKREQKAIRLSIFDNGCGFEEPPGLNHVGHAGLGLVSMAERTRLLAGRFELRSTPGTGTRLTVTLPLPATCT
ncbi:MAG TPA: two-component regulator propeller domain-containing protein [Verrucomicrobiae bacterium]|nr:two-component regulator propeller domain-containing protein [Verrucomicrobiae bacterium]